MVTKSKKKKAKVVAIKKAKPTKKQLSLNPRIGVDLGCGQTKVSPEYFMQNMQVSVDKVIGVDYVQTTGVDKVHDLFTFPFPFKDNSVDSVFASHFFEHIPGLLRGKFMDEVYRILKPDGKVRFVCPYGKSVRSMQDFTHQMPTINENTWLYFNKPWREVNKLTHGHYDLTCDFDFNPFLHWANDTWANKDDEPKMFGLTHYNEVISDITCDLIKRTGR